MSTATKQYRVVFASGDHNVTIFIDADTEDGARAFFEASFPGKRLISIALEKVDPCSAYERRTT